MNFSSELCFDRGKVRWKELLESARNGGFLLVNNRLLELAPIRAGRFRHFCFSSPPYRYG
jgi:hypothetical protein